MARLTVERVQALYEEYNHKWFSGRLPDDCEVELCSDLRQRKTETTRRERLLGATEKVDGVFRIQLSSLLMNGLWQLVLMHECIHVAVWPKSHRSKAWRDEVQRLAEAGYLLEIL
jgi:hypothetical protein